MTDQAHVNFEAIPDELKERDQWLLWDASNETPRRPHWRGDFRISWSSPDDWHSFEEAREAAQERESWGIGYVMALDNDDYARGLYGCIDIDGAVIERGKPKDWLPSLAPFIDNDAYMEFSPSGEGIHIPIVGHEAPEWWRDCHFSADEHEGVEYLTNKFCTFTGDVLEPAGDQVADEEPREWLLKVYKEINGKLPRLEPEADAGADDYDADRDLTKDEIVSAIDALDPGMEHDEWVKVGFAVHDWDSGSTGQSVFESWSSGSSKYDREAEREIEWIWSHADEGNGVTVGTLIHKAKNNGWTFPTSKPALDVVNTAESDDRDTSEPAAEAETDGGATVAQPTGNDGPQTKFQKFESDVVGAIEEVNGDDDLTQRTARHRIAQAFNSYYDFVYPEEDVRGWRTTLYVYDAEQGIYEPRGEAFVSFMLERAAADYVTNQVVNEIVGKLERMNVARGDQFRNDPNRLVVENGILDLHTGDLDPWSPGEFHRTKLDVRWNPDAGEAEAIDEFLGEIVDGKDVETLYRLIAHTLYKEYVTEKAAMLVGSGQNGKSVFLDVVENFLGDYNVSHRSLQAFEDKFAANQLEGKMANIHPDMGDESVKDMSVFKKLTGRDTMTADVKYESPIVFENFATLIFAANEMPVFGEDNHAIWRRWVYINFPHTFDEADPDAKDPVPKRKLMGRLTKDEEFEALLLRCQQEIQRWFEGGEWYPDAMGPEEVREQMKKAAEPVYDFAMTCLREGDEDAWIKKDHVRKCYREYATEEGLPKMGQEQFGERLVNLRDFSIETGRRSEEGRKVYTYDGVAFTERGRQVLGLDEPDGPQTTVENSNTAKKDVVEIVRELVEKNEGDAVTEDMVIGRAMGQMGKKTADRALEKLKDQGDVMCVDDDRVIDT